MPPPPVRKVLLEGSTPEETDLGEVWAETATPFGPKFRDKLWLDGPDAHLFLLQPDSEPEEGYLRHRIVASEALPVGSFRFELHKHYAFFQQCGYYDELSAIDYFVEVVARE